MRAHRFRPALDRLDSRIVLDASVVPAAAVVPSTSATGSVDVAPTVSEGLMPGEELDGPSIWNWYVTGAPPAPSGTQYLPPAD